MNFIAVVSPLFISYTTLILMSFGAKGGNKCEFLPFYQPWHLFKLSFLFECWFFFCVGWFGIRKDFCHFVLGACPLLQEYGNIAYNSQEDGGGGGRTPPVHLNQNQESNIELQVQANTKSEKRIIRKIDLMKPVVPIVSIDLPDWNVCYN